MNDPKIITPITTAPPPEPQLAAKPPETIRQTEEQNKKNTEQITQLPQATPGPTASPIQQPEAIPISLSETGEEKTNLSKTDKFLLFTNLSWSKVMAILLALQGLYGLYRSIHFILVEYPIMEEQLTAHTITSGEVNAFASKAIIIATSTILSMVFAVRLSVVKKASKIIQKIVAGTLFVANTAIMRYLNQIGSADIINGLTTKIIDLLRDIL